MKRTHHQILLALAGILLVLASAMPTVLPPPGIRSNQSQEYRLPPRTALYSEYRYTIGETGVAGSDNAHFNVTAGIAVNATGHLYVTDSDNHRVQVFDKAGVYQYTICGNGAGSGNNQLNTPYGVGLDTSGYVYVADSYNHRVQVFDRAGNYHSTIGYGYGSGMGEFDCPTGVAVHPAGYIYVADTNNHRVQVFDQIGVPLIIGETGVPDDDNFHFNAPFGVALNATGHLYVADTANSRVQVFDWNGNYRYTIGVAGVAGSDNGHFNKTYGVTTNSSGHVYVADFYNHRVQVFNKAGNYQYTICGNGEGNGNNQFNHTCGVAINATGHLYVADPANHRVQVFGVPAPTGLSILIDGGAMETGSTSVLLALSATGATEICFSNNSFSFTTWEAFSTTKAWTLDPVAGLRTVYFKTRCDLMEAVPVSDTILYVAPPSALSIIINSGAAETTSTSVTLTLSATGATEMCFSNNGITYTDWEAYGTSKAWVLESSLGPKVVYFKTRNSTIESVVIVGVITYGQSNNGVDMPVVVAITIGATGAGLAIGAVLMNHLAKKRGGSRPNR